MADMLKFNEGTDSTYGGNIQLHYALRKGLAAANAHRVFRQFATQYPMKKNHGKEFKAWRKLHSYDRALNDPEFAKKGFLTSRDLDKFSNDIISNAVLAEGSSAGLQIGMDNVIFSTKLQNFGVKTTYTQDMLDFGSTYGLADIKENLGHFVGELYEDLVQKDMLATSNTMYPSVATSLATMGEGVAADGSTDSEYRISYEFLKRAVAKLLKNRAKKQKGMITGSTKINSVPCGDAYYCIAPMQVIADIIDTVRIANNGKKEEFIFTPVHKYPENRISREGKRAEVCFGEVGTVQSGLMSIALISSERMFKYEGQGADVPGGYTGNLANTDGKFDVFPILFIGEDSFATVGLIGRENIKFHEQTPEQALDMENNAYGKKGFVSADFYYAGLITKEECLIKGLVCASDV